MEPTLNKETRLLEQLAQLQDCLEKESTEYSLVAYQFGSENTKVSRRETMVSGREALHSLGELGSRAWSSIHSLLEDCRLCCSAPSAPIVAILGLLNAGKSSLVSTYLSDEGRRRVLVGASNDQGTHRFVLWLPDAWKSNSVLWDNIALRLASIFGHPPEWLSDDPVEAANQYNDTVPRIDSSRDQRSGQSTISTSTIEIPLVAFDSGLDRWGIALMDCPDVQTGFLSNGNQGLQGDRLASAADSIAQARLDFLVRAAPICSSFVIVLPANAMHDQKVSQLMRLLRERMPHTKQIAAVNRVPRRYECETIQQELVTLYGRESLDRCYMAYGFDGPHMRDRLPVPDPTWNICGKDPLPLFFRIDRSPPVQPPAIIPKDDWLLNIGMQLDFESLLADSIRSHVSRLQSELFSALNMLKRQCETNLHQRKGMRDSLVNACLQFSLEPNAPTKVRMQASRKIIEQVSQSLERTAPWWAMPGRWTTRMAEYGKARVSQIGHWFKLPAWLSGKTEGLVQFIRSRWSSGDAAKVVTADSLVDSIQRFDRAGHWGLDNPYANSNEGVRTKLVNIVQRSIDRFQDESIIELDVSELDAVTSQMWEQMPWSKRLVTGLAPAAVLFAPLVAVMLLPLDFGGSSVLVFASLKELLGAGVAGLGIALLSPDRMPKIAESEAAWQQLGDLVATLCDSLDLERPSKDLPAIVSLGSEQRSIAISSLSIKAPARAKDDASSPTMVPRRMQVRKPQLLRLETFLQSLNI
ncbi:MAG: hypothetical protein ACK57V_08335 [Pirellula sp.]